jgi:hypothetical protein
LPPYLPWILNFGTGPAESGKEIEDDINQEDQADTKQENIVNLGSVMQESQLIGDKKAAEKNQQQDHRVPR